MAPPPLLPTTRLYACPACREHIKSDASVCPHCGAELPARGTLSRAASAVVVSLALTGCGSPEPEYGVPNTSDGTTTGSTSSGTTDGATSTTNGTDSASSTEEPTLGEPEYGVPATTTGTTNLPEPDYGVPTTESTTTDGTTTETSDTLGEPDYGVPGTTDLPEPEYGVPGTTGA